MDSQTHKAHRPAQSGAKADKKKGKGKEKSHGFNEKVRRSCSHAIAHYLLLACRHLRPSLVAGLRGKAGETLSVTRHVCTSPS